MRPVGSQLRPSCPLVVTGTEKVHGILKKGRVEVLCGPESFAAVQQTAVQRVVRSLARLLEGALGAALAAFEPPCGRGTDVGASRSSEIIRTSRRT